jgi:hypothetical protein
MTTAQEKDWAVMTATEQITVDDKRQAQVTFTVTNLQREAASVTATVVADDVAASWFRLERPVRHVEPGESTQYEVKAAVPEDAPPAEYSFQLLAYSSEMAPEERPTYSSRVLLRVPAKPVRPRRLTLILLLVGIGLAVVALVTTLVVVLVSLTEAGEPSTTPSAAELVRVPSVVGETEVEFIKEKLARVGLVADIRYVHSTSDYGAKSQLPAPLDQAPPGSVVTVDYYVAFTPPTVSITVDLPPTLLPAPPSESPGVAVGVEVSWQQQESYIQSWHVVFASAICEAHTPKIAMPSDTVTVNVARVRVVRHFTPWSSEGQSQRLVHSCSDVPEYVYVIPLDDLDLPGPSSPPVPIHVDLTPYEK